MNSLILPFFFHSFFHRGGAQTSAEIRLFSFCFVTNNIIISNINRRRPVSTWGRDCEWVCWRVSACVCVCVCSGGHKSLPRTWRNVETRWKQRLREYRINHNFACPKGRPVKALTFSQSGCVAVRVKIVKSWIVYCGDRRHRSAAAAAMAQMGRTAVKNLEAPRPLKSTLKQTHVHVPVYEVQSSE